jgi:hypothetical protein
MGVEIFVIVFDVLDGNGNSRLGKGIPLPYSENNQITGNTWGGIYYDTDGEANCDLPRCTFGQGCCANDCGKCWNEDDFDCCLGREVEDTGDLADGQEGLCPWPGWSKYNCREYHLRKLASDENHYYTVENYEEILEKISLINSKFCDTGTRCCKNLNKSMCSHMGGSWKPGYCHNEGALCTNYGTRTCGTSSLCGSELYVGACCIQGTIDTICENNMTLESCTEIGGEHRGVGSYCEEQGCGDTGHNNGACCYIDSSGYGDCHMRSAITCVTTGGIWDGRSSCDDVHCCDETDNPSGACCYWSNHLGQSICNVEPDCICEQIGGSYAGVGTNCSDTNCDNVYMGGCCDNGECEEKLINECSNDGWDGRSCDEFCCESTNTGICCIGTECFNYTQCVCERNGGLWGEAGTSCDVYSCNENYETLQCVEIDTECRWVMCPIVGCPHQECDDDACG